MKKWDVQTLSTFHFLVENPLKTRLFLLLFFKQVFNFPHKVFNSPWNTGKRNGFFTNSSLSGGKKKQGKIQRWRGTAKLSTFQRPLLLFLNKT